MWQGSRQASPTFFGIWTGRSTNALFDCILVLDETLYTDVAFCPCCVHYVSIQHLSCSKYQDIHEVVPRKLFKAWDRDNQAIVALKLVEVYGFEAASAWADRDVAVPSMLIRYACLVADFCVKLGVICHMTMVPPIAYWSAILAVVLLPRHMQFFGLQKTAWWIFNGVHAMVV